MTNAGKLSVQRLGQDPPIADWLEALSHDSPFERPPTSAARKATFAGLESLLCLLKDSDPDIRLQAATALGELGGEARRVLAALHEPLGEVALQDDDAGVRAEAVRALLRVGPQPATEAEALLGALHSEVDTLRFHAAVVLGDLGAASRPAVPALIHASLWDEEPAIRVEAARALWKIDRKGTVAVAALVQALDDPNELICWIAAECLGQMGPTAVAAVPALRQALQRKFKIALVKTGVRLALEQIEAPATAEAR